MGKASHIEASTQWNAENYTDSSNSWKDSVLIAMKVQEITSITSIIETLSAWIEIKPDPKIESIQRGAESIQQASFDISDHYAEAKLRSLLLNPQQYPDWYRALLALMRVYIKREDLQTAFPKVSSQCDLTELVRWAREHGTSEEQELSKYRHLYGNI